MIHILVGYVVARWVGQQVSAMCQDPPSLRYIGIDSNDIKASTVKIFIFAQLLDFLNIMSRNGRWGAMT